MSIPLLDLDPRWFGDLTSSRLGFSFLCPHCRNTRLGVAFANPENGAPPIKIVNDHMPGIIRMFLDTEEFDVPPGFHWTRVGTDFDHLTITPSVDASKSGHWHGSITNGQCA